MTLWTSLVGLAKLPLAEKLTAVGVLALLPTVAIAVRVLGFRSVCLRLESTAPSKLKPLSAGEIARLSWLVDRIANGCAWKPSCLSRTLVLRWLLHRRGLHTDLRIGVRKSGGALAAHCWLEHDAVPINERPDVGNTFKSFADPISYSARSE